MKRYADLQSPIGAIQLEWRKTLTTKAKITIKPNK